MDSLIGQRLKHYTIVDKLGEGGMGVVYLAEDRSLGRQVAIKVLPEAAADDDTLLERLKREARVIANLSHPNIVTLYAVEKEELSESSETPGEGRTFLVMELIEGETLTHHIPAGGMTLGQFFEVAIPIADAIATAHEAGISHRDIKPSNVLVSKQGWVKVLDFGLAKQGTSGQGSGADEITQAIEDQLTTEGSVMGTVPYMAPEQLMGRAGGPTADVFSLGVVFYQMLTGRHPFRSGRSSAEVVSAILRDQPKPLDELQIEIPNHLGRILRRCLEKEPERRYQQAIELKNELLGLQGEVNSGAWQSLSQAHSGGFVRSGSQKSKPGIDGVTRFVDRVPGGLKGVVAAGGTAVAALFLATGLLSGGYATEQPAEEETKIVAPERKLPADALTLAVMPIEDLGPSEDTSFARGLTSEISSVLTGLTGLNVVAQGSVDKVALESPRVISESLGVNHLLRGNIAWDDSTAESQVRRARINLRLIHAESELQVWSDSWTSTIQSTLEAQTEIARHVAEGIGETLLGILPVEDSAIESMLADTRVEKERATVETPVDPTPTPIAADQNQEPKPNIFAPGTAEEADATAPLVAVTDTDTQTEGKSTVHVEFHSKVREGIVTIYAGSRAVLRQNFRFAAEEASFFEDTISFADEGAPLRVYVVPKGEAARYRSFDLDGNNNTELILRVDKDGGFSGELSNRG